MSNERRSNAADDSAACEREANAPAPVDVEVSSERNAPPPKTVPGKVVGNSEPVVRSESDIRSAPTIQAPGDQSDPIVGRHIMDWRISHRLGEGGMGTVYLAVHKKMGERRKKVAKVLPADSTPADKERFWREAETAADVGGDERVVQVDTYDQWPDGRAYILMEFIEGPTLQQEIARSAPFSEEKALKQIAHRVVDTMAMLHASKIVHRDLKPSNIMLPPKRGGGFRVKLIDFGVAKPPASLGRFGTDRRIACGTPGYWSPEAASAMELDARTDVFSLGVILFEMLTGELPFPVDGDMMAGLTRLLTAPIQSINPIRMRKGHAPVSPDVETLIGRCLARKSHERPWMDEVHRELSLLIEQLGAVGVVRIPMATMRSVAPPEVVEQLPRPASASDSSIADMSDMIDRMQSRRDQVTQPGREAASGRPSSASAARPRIPIARTGRRPRRRSRAWILLAGVIVCALIIGALLIRHERDERPTIESDRRQLTPPQPTAEKAHEPALPVAERPEPPQRPTALTSPASVRTIRPKVRHSKRVEPSMEARPAAPELDENLNGLAPLRDEK